MSSIAVFIALGGGAYAAISSIPGRDGVIHGCYQKKNGNLRLIAAGKGCSKSEKAIAFNQQGRPGNQGIPGTQGVPGAPSTPGARGEQGAQGPGATSFSTTLAPGSGTTTIATLTNGLLVEAECVSSASVLLFLKTADGSEHLQASGTEYYEGGVIGVDTENTSSYAAGSGLRLDLHLIARNSGVGRFARVDLHGRPGSPCTFWGMIIPSS
jgi:hypothetical protein